MNYDKLYDTDYSKMPSEITSAKERCRGSIYAQAGDDKTILGRTNDMTAWLYQSLIKLLQSIQSEEFNNIQTTAKTILAEHQKITSLETTVDLKGADVVINRFLENNHTIQSALKEHNKLEEAANA